MINQNFKFRFFMVCFLLLSWTSIFADANKATKKSTIESTISAKRDHAFFMKAAIAEAKKSAGEGGIPIGSVLVIDNKIVGRGHNQRIQKGSAILHGEMDCLENAGRLKPADYQKATLYTTLSPCDMCSGAVLLYKIPHIVAGENKTFMGNESYLRRRGIKVTVLNDKDCITMMENFIKKHPKLWNEDIGKPDK